MLLPSTLLAKSPSNKMRFASLFLFGCALVSAATTPTDKIVKTLQKIEKLSQDAIPKVNKLTVEDGNRLNETSGRFQNIFKAFDKIYDVSGEVTAIIVGLPSPFDADGSAAVRDAFSLLQIAHSDFLSALIDKSDLYSANNAVKAAVTERVNIVSSEAINMSLGIAILDKSTAADRRVITKLRGSLARDIQAVRRYYRTPEESQ
ncbi:unnamed protein product [Clonostachys rosea f. rosea IK726]|uniref:Uncharacterized protein n=2 Tax=Bionectria ochroleuca TaxID=29856 RepID=A0A0B7K7D3_BIOOC|nr:unnamed protein product [Clonostachys rosea f. rosea IK726]